MRGASLLLFLALGPVLALPAAAEEPPFPIPDTEARRLWDEAVALELEKKVLESAEKWEQLVALQPDQAHFYWRTARNYLRAGDGLPVGDRKGKFRLFGLTQDWARRGAEIDPRCAECVLYQFVGLARVATTRGILESARNAAELVQLLDRAFELGPSHKDADWNDERANLHYAAGIFYRSVPEGKLVEWTVGVQGDRRRALEHLRKAAEILPKRIDYWIELGAQALCLGSRESNDALTAEGQAALARIPDLPSFQANDPIDRQHALLLAAAPDEACAYDRDTWLANGKGPAR